MSDNTCLNSSIILYHWGTVNALEADVFNADPSVLDSLVVNPERVVLLAPGEPYVLRKIRQ